MDKLKLTKYQVVLMVLFFIVYTATLQISSRSILEKQVQNMPSGMNISQEAALFWVNIATIFFGIILVIFQSLIYKVIISILGIRKNFSIGMNLFLFLSAILPGSIIIALFTFLNKGISISQNLWVNIFSVFFSTFMYSILLWYFSIIKRRKIIVVFSVIFLLNIIL
ncbi:hypothetical protein BU046_12745, partial [Staphylococcus simulans]